MRVLYSEMTADVFELFSLALLSPTEAKGGGRGKGIPSSDCYRFSYLLQQLQQKFGAACRASLKLFLLGIAEALLREECSKPGAPSKMLQVWGSL